MKKHYEKPALTTRTVALGVFGTYANDPDGRGGDVLPRPLKIVTDRRYTLE